jgi:hypothetical protein
MTLLKQVQCDHRFGIQTLHLYLSNLWAIYLQVYLYLCHALVVLVLTVPLYFS